MTKGFKKMQNFNHQSLYVDWSNIHQRHRTGQSFVTAEIFFFVFYCVFICQCLLCVTCKPEAHSFYLPLVQRFKITSYSALNLFYCYMTFILLFANMQQFCFLLESAKITLKAIYMQSCLKRSRAFSWKIFVVLNILFQHDFLEKTVAHCPNIYCIINHGGQS